MVIDTDKNYNNEIFIDGTNHGYTYGTAGLFAIGYGAGDQAALGTLIAMRKMEPPVGLHKVEGKFKVSESSTLQGTHYRNLIVEQKTNP